MHRAKAPKSNIYVYINWFVYFIHRSDMEGANTETSSTEMAQDSVLQTELGELRKLYPGGMRKSTWGKAGLEVTLQPKDKNITIKFCIKGTYSFQYMSFNL